MDCTELRPEDFPDSDLPESDLAEDFPSPASLREYEEDLDTESLTMTSCFLLCGHELGPAASCGQVAITVSSTFNSSASKKSSDVADGSYGCADVSDFSARSFLFPRTASSARICKQSQIQRKV